MGLRDKYKNQNEKPASQSEGSKAATSDASQAPNVEELRSKLRGKGLGKVNPPEAADNVGEDALAPKTGPNGESPAQATEEAPKKGRGRPAGSKNKETLSKTSTPANPTVSTTSDPDVLATLADSLEALVKVLRNA